MALGRWGGLSERTMAKFKLRNKILDVLVEESVVASVPVVVFANECCRENENGQYCSCSGPPKWLSKEQKKRWYGLGEDARRERYEKQLKEENPDIDKPKEREASWIGGLRRERSRIVAELGFETLPREALGPEAAVILHGRGGPEELKSHWMDESGLESVVGEYHGRQMTALERINQPDLKGFIVRDAEGRVLNPFATGHVAYRLEMAGIRSEMLSEDGKSGPLYDIIRGDPFTVELKPGDVSNAASAGPRFPNRIHLIEGVGGRKVALNIIRNPDTGRVISAFIEDATGIKSTNPPAPVKVRELMESAGKTLANTMERTPASSRSGPRRGGGGGRR